MKMKGKLVVLWLFVMLIVAVVLTKVGGQLLFVLQHCLASVSAMRL
jgi:hypothetical protein